MKRLGAYISPHADTWASSPYFTKGCFVYYEHDSNNYIAPQVKIWRLDANVNQNPDEIILLKSPDELKKHIEPREAWANHHISYRDRTYRIRNMACKINYFPDIEIIDELSVDAVDHYETWKYVGPNAIHFLKDAKLTDLIHYRKPKITLNDWVTQSAFDDMIKKEIQKSIEKETLNSIYGMGGFTTNPDPFKVVKIAEKETKTMEKKMTETDAFLKDLDEITIASTYSKLDCGCGKPYYIYYPEMEITEDIADTLLTILLMAKRDFIHKVVFNPEKGTTTLYRNYGKNMITVRCRDGKFDYILGYEMARSKMYIGADDYNWFNKIKNHRKTHIEYTEKKNKKGGKKS